MPIPNIEDVALLVESVARGLDPLERYWLRETPAMMPVPAWYISDGHTYAAFARRRPDLIASPERARGRKLYRLTPLGEQVRTHLTKEKNDGK